MNQFERWASCLASSVIDLAIVEVDSRSVLYWFISNWIASISSELMESWELSSFIFVSSAWPFFAMIRALLKLGNPNDPRHVQCHEKAQALLALLEKDE